MCFYSVVSPPGRGRHPGATAQKGSRRQVPAVPPGCAWGLPPVGSGTLGRGKQEATSTPHSPEQANSLRPQTHTETPQTSTRKDTRRRKGAWKAAACTRLALCAPHPHCSLAFSAHTQTHCPAAPATCPNTLHTHHPAKAPTCLHTGFLVPLGPHTPCRQGRGNFPQQAHCHACKLSRQKHVPPTVTWDLPAWELCSARPGQSYLAAPVSHTHISPGFTLR